MGHGGDGFRREDIVHSAIEKAKTESNEDSSSKRGCFDVD
jgi:hypothetical protein